MLNKVKIGPKLIGGFLMLAAIAGIIGAIGLMNIIQIGDVCLPGIESLSNIKECQNRVITGERGLLISQIFNDQSLRNAQYDWIKNAFEDAEISYKRFEKLSMTKAEAEQWSVFVQKWDEWKRLHSVFMNAVKAKEHAMSSKAGNDSLVQFYDAKMDETSLDSRRGYLDANKVLENLVQLNADDARISSRNAKTILITLIFVGLVIAIVTGLLLTNSITRPLSMTVKMIQEMGKGHLGMRLELSREDEIGIMASAMDRFATDLQQNVVAVMQSIAAGDLSMHVTAKDSKDEISPALQKTVQSLQNLISEIKVLASESVQGNLGVRGKADTFLGAYREIVQGINNTMDAILNPINEATTVLQQVANRDLTSRVRGDYKGDHAKIKTALNTTIENLDTALTQVSEATGQVSSASQQISSGSQSLAQGANEQASSLEEVSSSLEEMSSMTKQNADNASQAKLLANEADKNATIGTDSMKMMTEAIHRIKESSDQTAKIVKTIDEIAMQTNLLALNAAVEAARAGEAGRGFAVVAEEVRNLAQRSAQAAKSTADMITESVKNADNGVQIAEEVSNSFQLITSSSRKVNDLIAEIAAASQEQAQGIDQVNTAVAQMDKVTQQNAANSEESASAAEELSSQAEELQNMIAQFRLTAESMRASIYSRSSQKPSGKNSGSYHQRSKNCTSANRTDGNGKKQKIDPEQLIPFDDSVLTEF